MNSTVENFCSQISGQKTVKRHDRHPKYLMRRDGRDCDGRDKNKQKWPRHSVATKHNLESWYMCSGHLETESGNKSCSEYQTIQKLTA